MLVWVQSEFLSIEPNPKWSPLSPLSHPLVVQHSVDGDSGDVSIRSKMSDTLTEAKLQIDPLQGTKLTSLQNLPPAAVHSHFYVTRSMSMLHRWHIVMIHAAMLPAKVQSICR